MSPSDISLRVFYYPNLFYRLLLPVLANDPILTSLVDSDSEEES